ncbi:hypothetical protein FDECE_12241 [Fusarium decemcellulare]|nr:hypothetical protein FDECE_12241 [Fusarium decemcellulare]
MDLGLGLEDSVVVITGAGGQIGQVIVDAFLSAGCYVGAFDIDGSKFNRQHERLLWIAVDTSHEEAMTTAWHKVEEHFHAFPSVCVCAAAMDLSFIEHHKSITNMSVDQFRKTIDVNTTGTFITAKAWLSRLQSGMEALKTNAPEAPGPKNISLIIIGSEAGILGVPGNADYAASKSAVQYGLTLSLAPDAANIHPRARVNAVCPGAVDTAQFRRECAENPSSPVRWIESEATVASRKPVQTEDVARLCLTLASERWSASTTGQVLRVDGGKSGRLYWDNENRALW